MLYFWQIQIKKVIIYGNWIEIMLCIFYLVNLVSLGHNHTVPLNNHCVCVHAALMIICMKFVRGKLTISSIPQFNKIIFTLFLFYLYIFLLYFFNQIFWCFLFTADCVLQSCPPIVRSSLANTDKFFGGLWLSLSYKISFFVINHCHHHQHHYQNQCCHHHRWHQWSPECVAVDDINVASFASVKRRF